MTIEMFPSRIEMMKAVCGSGMCAVGAELGVWRGEFSVQLLNELQPRTLHLVDCWCQQVNALDWCKRCDDYHLADMRYVQRRFAREIQSSQVAIHQAFTTVFLTLLPEDYLAWAFIDGDHRYEVVRDELRILDLGKMAAGGIIACHDYVDPAKSKHARKRKWGVKQAVDKFCAETDWKIVAHGGPRKEPTSSCALRRV